MAVTAPEATTEAPDLKLCPTCGRTTPAYRNRCHNCWNDVAHVATMPPEQAAERVAVEQAFDERRARAAALHRRTTRIVRGGAATALVLLTLWWGYRTFIYTPPPLPLPTSTERAVVAGPDVWPIEGGDVGSTRATTAVVNFSGEIAWTSDIGARVATSIVSDAQTLFVTLTDARIVALSAQDGRELWSTQLQNAPWSAPTVAGDRLYVPLRQGVLLALDTRTGEVAFETEATRSSFGTSPLILDGVVYIFGTGEIYGFDAETGEQLWTRPIDSNWAFVTPVAQGQYLAVATGDRTLIYDRVSGEQTFFYDFKRAHPYSLVAADNVIYSISPRLGAAVPVDARRPWWEGFRRAWLQFNIWGMAPDVPLPPAEWVSLRPPREGYPVVVALERLLLATPEGDLRAYDRRTGEVLWDINRVVEPIVSIPVFTGGGLLITNADALTLIDPADGSVIGRRELPGGLERTIVTSHGTYVATVSGSVLALR